MDVEGWCVLEAASSLLRRDEREWVTPEEDDDEDDEDDNDDDEDEDDYEDEDKDDVDGE